MTHLAHRMKLASAAALLAFASLHATAQPASVVFFTEWSALLDDAARNVVRTAADSIANDSSAKVTVSGYADTTGSAEANELMSTLRAQVVMDLLVEDGVPATRITRAGRGATPDVGGKLESRRVVITVSN